MVRRHSRLALVMVAAVVLIAAVIVGQRVWWHSDPPDDAGPPGMSGPTPSLDPATDGVTTPAAEWDRCPELQGGVDPDTPGLRCAELTVPLDYAEPDGEQLEVVVSRLTSADDPEADSTGRPVLVSNPGGPGATGLFNTLGVDGATDGRLRERFDLVGLDPRGVNLSSPVRCAVSDEDVGQLTSGLVADDVDTDLALGRRVARGCAQESGDLLPHLGTLNAARDLELLRRSLHTERLSLVGTSYGGELMTTYASLFPDHTGRVVLDSPTDVTVPWPQARREQASIAARRAEVVLRRLAEPRWGLGDDADDVRRRLTALLADLDRTPRTLGGERIDGDALVEARVLPALGDDSQVEPLARVLQVLLDVPGAPSEASLLRSLGGGEAATPVNGQSLEQQVLASTAIRCADDPWPGSSATYRQWLLEDRRRAPLTRGSFSRVTPCAAWPDLTREPKVAITDEGWRGQANVLVLHRRLDLSSPEPGVRRLLTALGQRAELLERPGAGHVLLGNDAEATEAVVRWLTDE